MAKTQGEDAYVRNGQEVEEYPRMDLEDVNVDELGEGETSEDEPLGAEDDLEVRWAGTDSSLRKGRYRRGTYRKSSWKPRRIWGMKMGLVETESKRKRSSRGDLEGGGSLLDDARE